MGINDRFDTDDEKDEERDTLFSSLIYLILGLMFPERGIEGYPSDIRNRPKVY